MKFELNKLWFDSWKGGLFQKKTTKDEPTYCYRREVVVLGFWRFTGGVYGKYIGPSYALYLFSTSPIALLLYNYATSLPTSDY